MRKGEGMKYQQKPGIISTLIEEESVILHPVDGKVLVLNEAGSYLWGMLNEQVTVDGLFEKFTAVYHTPLEQAQQEIHSFVTSLAQKELLDVWE